MTKYSKILTILVTAFSVLFLGVAAVMWTAQTDWKEKATKDFPQSKISEQRTRIGDLNKEIEGLDKQQKAAETGIAQDSLAITAPETGRVALLEVELQQLIDEARKVADQVEEEAKKVGEKQDDGKRLRERVMRLTSQYDDLVAQKEDAAANVKRLRDLLFQAKGVLERVEKRRESLKAEGGGNYPEEPAATEATLRSPARTAKSL